MYGNSANEIHDARVCTVNAKIISTGSRRNVIAHTERLEFYVETGKKINTLSRFVNNVLPDSRGTPFKSAYEKLHHKTVLLA